MITESMIIRWLHNISLVLTPLERWEAAKGTFNTDSVTRALLTVFAIVALIISVVLLFRVFAKHRRSENRLNLKSTELTIANVKFRQKNNELKANNENLRQENAELYRKQVEVKENIIQAETPSK